MTVLAGREPVTPYQPGDHVRQKRCISTLNIRIGGGAMLTYSTSNLRTGVRIPRVQVFFQSSSVGREVTEARRGGWGVDGSIEGCSQMRVHGLNQCGDIRSASRESRRSRTRKIMPFWEVLRLRLRLWLTRRLTVPRGSEGEVGRLRIREQSPWRRARCRTLLTRRWRCRTLLTGRWRARRRNPRRRLLSDNWIRIMIFPRVVGGRLSRAPARRGC